MNVFFSLLEDYFSFLNLNSLIYTLGIGFGLIQTTCMYFLSLLSVALGDFSPPKQGGIISKLLFQSNF